MRRGGEVVVPVEKEPPTVVKKVTRKYTKSKKNIKKKKKPQSRVPCAYCNRRTKCKDGICMICKAANVIYTSHVTNDSEKLDLDSKEPSRKKSITNIQSVIIKPAKQNTRKNISNGTPSSSTQPSFVRERRTRSSRAIEPAESNSNEVLPTDPMEVCAVEPFSIMSDIENLLEQADPEQEQRQEENFLVSLNEIHSILGENLM